LASLKNPELVNQFPNWAKKYTRTAPTEYCFLNPPVFDEEE